jgi:hypothetical protein
MGQTFAHNDHAEASENTEQRPETDNGIAEKMYFVPLDIKIEHHGKDQKNEKDPFQHTRMFVEIFEESHHYLTTIRLIILRKRSG